MGFTGMGALNNLEASPHSKRMMKNMLSVIFIRSAI
jgi:hypothetical protein